MSTWSAHIAAFALLNFLVCCTLLVAAAPQSWEYAVTSKSKILFFDENWREVTSSAHQFDKLLALAFDETEEVLYFNDERHQNGSIFSLKLPISSEDSHIIETMVQRGKMDRVRGIAYDPLNRNLFWSDAQLRKIYFVSVDGLDTALTPPKVLIDFTNETTIPDGIAVDVCRRKLYWTNSNFKNASLECIDLDGTNRKLIVGNDLYFPHGIVVDQLSDRIYWVNGRPGVYFSVESAQLDGSNRHILLHSRNNQPLALAVSRNEVFWTDQTHIAVWAYPKQWSNESSSDAVSTNPPHLRKVANFEESVGGVVARSHFYQTLQNDQHCADVVTKITKRLLTPKVTRSPADRQLQQLQREYCLNGGTYVLEKGICICALGYKGSRCESNECHNYCVHGTCDISVMGFPKCYCQHGFYGERCQSAKCAGYCFNDGICIVDKQTGEPTCDCGDNFGGQRCEHNSTETCALFCRILKYEPDTYVPYNCHDVCEAIAERAETVDLPYYPHLESCRPSRIWTRNIILLIVSVLVLCLGLIASIVHGLRRIYKPARPRIKKTFVVRKQARTNSASDTPLTNRPLATEQCEITIENCCNMNICETPCFDPKLVEQTLSSRDVNTCFDPKLMEQTLSARDSKIKVKEDKKILIHNMEDDLY